MRLPPDTVLICAPGAAPELEAVWREERLPTLPGPDWDAARDATTLVVVDDAAAAAEAVGLGYRVFFIGEAAAPVLPDFAMIWPRLTSAPTATSNSLL